MPLALATHAPKEHHSSHRGTPEGGQAIRLRRERAVVRRVPVNRVVAGPVAVRQEGRVTIVPVLEEVPVVTMQLVLKEELHIEMRTSKVGARREVVVRSENVTVTRDSEPQRPLSEVSSSIP